MTLRDLLEQLQADAAKRRHRRPKRGPADQTAGVPDGGVPEHHLVFVGGDSPLDHQWYYD